MNESIPMEQKQILIGCRDRKEFIEKFTLAFSGKLDPMKFSSRVNNIWYSRERHLKEIAAFQKQQHTVLVPKEIKTKAVPVSRGMTFAEDELLVKIHNQLVLNGKLLEEQLCLFRKLAEVKA